VNRLAKAGVRALALTAWKAVGATVTIRRRLRRRLELYGKAGITEE